MVFSSITFIFWFLPLVLAAYFIVPGIRKKNLVLLIASLFFYAWGEPVYIFLMLISICGNFYLVRFTDKAKKEGRPVTRHFVFTIAWNIGILFFFKYSNMVIGIINRLGNLSIRELELSLPIGISFYTFQALSYVIDVYKDRTKCQENILDFALYICMFPQLIAGPIVKYTQIEHALKERKVTPESFGKGAEYFIFGLAKKVLIANNVGMIFTQISQADSRSFLGVWLGALAYTFQIYFDFSGYSDMAIGLGFFFGFRFPINFSHPYISASVTEFWRRWHITLSSWFRDYVYIPMGGNRVGKAKHIRNILIVWTLTGLWHGASGNFIVWGLYYAAWLILEKYFIGEKLKENRIAGHIITGLAFIFGWVIFAFTDFGSLGKYLGQMFGIGVSGFADQTALYLLASSFILFLIAALASTPYPYKLYKRVFQTAGPLAVAFLLILLVISCAYLVYQSYNPFLYFRF